MVERTTNAFIRALVGKRVYVCTSNAGGALGRLVWVGKNNDLIVDTERGEMLIFGKSLNTVMEDKVK